MLADKEKIKIKIHIGDYYASIEPAVVQTTLGSCVAVCLYDPVQRIGGMNHILLPGRADRTVNGSKASFAQNAIELLIKSIIARGGKRHRLVAKAFGGGHVLPGISLEKGVGRQIVKYVVDFLKDKNIELLSCDFGGSHTRQVYFHTDTGRAFLKRGPSAWQARNVMQEEQWFARLTKTLKRAAALTILDSALPKRGPGRGGIRRLNRSCSGKGPSVDAF